MDKLLLLFWLLVILITLCSQCEGDEECQLPHPYQGHYISKKWKDKTCYYLFTKKTNWYESKRFCREKGFSMVKVTEEMLDNGFSISRIFGNDIPSADVWLGGRAIALAQWTFLNGAILNLTIARESPVFADPRNYALCGNIIIDGQNMVFGVSSCYDSYSFLCRSKNCTWNETCLKLIKTPMTWFEARSHCISLGGDLFYMNNNETLYSSKLIFDTSLYGTIKNLASVFIGLRRRSWEWTDGTEILHTNWHVNEPNTFSEQCLVYLYTEDGKWNDNACHDAKLTLCEAPSEKASTRSNPNSGISATITEPSIPTDSMGSKVSRVTDAPLTSPFMIIIILACLLGVFFIITLALVIFISCRKCRHKSIEDDAEFTENTYYDSSSEQIQQTPVATPPNPLYTNSDISAETLSSHLHKVPETNDAAAQSMEKPRIRPKPIFGPKTGDVYSSVEKVNRSPLRPFNSTEYVNTT